LAISRDELLRLAREGARARVDELSAELESIYATFPDLKTAAGKSTSVKTRRTSTGARQGAITRAWSDADRKAVSERMKKYWAARRKSAASKPAR
jgi:hypothetical protein